VPKDTLGKLDSSQIRGYTDTNAVPVSPALSPPLFCSLPLAKLLSINLARVCVLWSHTAQVILRLCLYRKHKATKNSRPQPKKNEKNYTNKNLAHVAIPTSYSPTQVDSRILFNPQEGYVDGEYFAAPFTVRCALLLYLCCFHFSPLLHSHAFTLVNKFLPLFSIRSRKKTICCCRRRRWIPVENLTLSFFEWVIENEERCVEGGARGK